MTRSSFSFTALLFALTACQTDPRSDQHGETDYKTYHQTNCRPEISEVCVETMVKLEWHTIASLIEDAQDQHKKHPKIVAIRIGPRRSPASITPSIEVVSGTYETVNGRLWAAVEEVSVFVLENGDWDYLETNYVLYDPV